MRKMVMKKTLQFQSRRTFARADLETVVQIPLCGSGADGCDRDGDDDCDDCDDDDDDDDDGRDCDHDDDCDDHANDNAKRTMVAKALKNVMIVNSVDDLCPPPPPPPHHHHHHQHHHQYDHQDDQRQVEVLTPASQVASSRQCSKSQVLIVDHH